MLSLAALMVLPLDTAACSIDPVEPGAGTSPTRQVEMASNPPAAGRSAAAPTLAEVVAPTQAAAAPAEPGTPAEQPAAWTLDVAEQVVLKVERGAVAGSVVASTDRRHAAYVVATGDGRQVVWDAARGPVYDAIGTLALSPDGQRLAYPARRDGQWFVVADGNEQKPYDAVEPVVFSPNGARLAYKATRGRTALVVLDGNESPPYLELNDTALVFSPDSQHLAYLAFERGRGLFERGNGILVLDGQPGVAYDRLGQTDPTFSPDSRHVAYWAQRGQEAMVVLDGAELRPYQGRGSAYTAIGNASLVFSPDSQHLAYVALRGNSQTVVVDNVEQQTYDGIGRSAEKFLPRRQTSLTFSPDSQHVAYIAERADKQLVVRDGVEGAAYAGIIAPEPGAPLPRFSPDSRRLAYYAYTGESMRLVVDAAEGPPYEMFAPDLQFSPDGSHVAYSARRAGQWRIVLDGADGRVQSAMPGVAFDPPGEWLAFVADQLGRPVPAVRDQDGHEVLAAVAYDGVLRGGLVADGPSRFDALVYRGSDLLRVEVTVSRAKATAMPASLASAQARPPDESAINVLGRL